MNIKSGVLVFACALLGACGGGGGGGGGGGDKRDDGFQIQLQQSSIALEFREGTAPANQTVTATWRGTPPQPLYLTARLEGVGIANTIPITLTQTSASAVITAAQGLAEGTYSGRVLFLACSDSACANPIGGTPLPISYTVTVRAPVFRMTGAAPIRFDHVYGAALPIRTLSVGSTAAGWTATASTPWITLSQTSGTGAAELAISIDPQDLTASRYTGTVTVTSAALGAQTVAVELNLGMPAFEVLGNWIFSGVNGAAIPTETWSVVTSQGAVLPMSVTSDQPWIVIDSASPTASGQFGLGVDPSASALASGQHEGSVHVRLQAGPHTIERTLPVRLTLTQPTLTVSPETIVLGGASGRTFTPVPVTVALNTGTRAHPWSSSALPDWVTTDANSGTVSDAGAVIQLQPHRLQTTPGTSTTTMTFTAQVNGDTVSRTVPVEFNLDEHKLIAATNGVAFAELPGAQSDRLSTRIAIRDNFAIATDWQVQGDAAWLTATRSGNDVVLSADASALASDVLQTATVTITSDDSTIVGPERIRVGLWKGSQMPTTNQRLYADYDAIEADSIRPYIYGHIRGETQIRVFNVYDGAELSPIAGVPEELRAMTTSQDGEWLYGLVLGGESIVAVRLSTGVASEIQLPESVFGIRFDLQYVRPNGEDILLDNRSTAFLPSGESVGGGISYEFGVSGNSEFVFQGRYRNTLDYTSAGGGRFTRVPIVTLPLDASFIETAASNIDGSRVYTGVRDEASGYKLVMYNGRTMTADTVVEVATPTRIADLRMTATGQLLLSTADNYSQDFTVFNADNTIALGPLDLNMDSLNGLASSGDGNIAIVVDRFGMILVPIP